MNDLKALTIPELLELGAAGTIHAVDAVATNDALSTPEGQRAFAEALLGDPRYAGPSMFASNARAKVVHQVVARRDPSILALLRSIAADPAHPLQEEALGELLSTGDRAIIEPLYPLAMSALDTLAFRSFTHDMAKMAAYLMGAEAVVRDLVPRYLTPAVALKDPTAMTHAGMILHEILHRVQIGQIERDHAGLIAAVVALADAKPMRIPTRKLLAKLDPAAVARATAQAGGAAAPPATGKTKSPAGPAQASKKTRGAPAVASGATGYLARYQAGEHRAVWSELRALGDRVREPAIEPEARAVAEATMKAFGANVDRIARALKKAKYALAEKKPVRPARAGAAAKVAELATLVGPLPLALEAFHRTFDGVSLAQDVDAVIDDSPVFGEGLLDELGRRDPLIVAGLSAVLEDAEAQRARGVASPLAYVGPDPACKGTVDDEIPDENPVRASSSSSMDAELTGGASGHFVDWLRAYVDRGGFLGDLDEADRAHLLAGLQPF